MTITHHDARSAYQGNMVATATPAQLLVLLVDRLALDAERGLRALMARDHSEANKQLQHAQAIVTELEATLDPEGWAGGHELMAVYDYLRRRLLQANVRKDQRAAREAVVLARRIRDTWRRAAVLAAQS